MSDDDSFDNSRLARDIQSKGNWFAQRTLGQIVLMIVSVVVVLSIAGGIINYATSWLHTGTAIVSPANVKTQFANGYSDYESLKALASNYCNMKAAAAAATDPNIKSQRESQAFDFQLSYNRVAAEYDQAYENVFQGKLVKPSDLPSRAETLPEMVKKVC